MSSTRERDAFPKTLSRCTRWMFSCTEASTSQWESSVFVSPIKAPALMILDVYRAERGSRSFALAVLGGMIFKHGLPESVPESLPASQAINSTFAGYSHKLILKSRRAIVSLRNAGRCDAWKNLGISPLAQH